MADVELLLRASRPGPLSAGPHRERLARRLRERRGQLEPPAWEPRRYALALAFSALCLALALLAHPREIDFAASAAERAAILGELLRSGPAAPLSAPPAATQCKALRLAPVSLPEILRANRELLRQTLQEAEEPPQKPAKD